MKQQVALRSSFNKGDDATQPFRVVLHQLHGGPEWSTHLENLEKFEDTFISKKSKDFYWGHYFGDDYAAAYEDYLKRCKKYGFMPNTYSDYHISPDEYRLLCSRLAEFEKWRNGRTSYRTDEVPVGLEVSNDDRTKIEIYEFHQLPPDKYFAYVRNTDAPNNVEITTWTGVVLGCALVGREFKTPAFGGFGSKRRQILTFKAINGERYYGTYYQSSGDFCRLKKVKAKVK